MALPVELEIFIKDYTKNAMESIKKGISETEDDTVRLISMLKKLRAEKAQIVKANKKAGQSYAEEAAEVQALTGKINDLNNTLKEIKKAKEEASKTSIDIDTETVERKTNNLRMQFSQVARELPSLAMGPQMFILAISNNLPMLADAIADVRKQNELLAASGKKAVPVWRQLLGACWSWQTALIAAISVGIMFGKDIANWVKNLGKAKKELSETLKIQEALNTAHRKGGEAAAEESAKLRILYAATQDAGKSMDERKKAVEALQRMYPDYFGKLTDEAVLAGNAASAYDELTKAIIRKGQAQAAEDIVADYSKQNWQLQRGINADANWTNRNRDAYEEAQKRDQERRKWLRQHTSDQGSSIVRGIGNAVIGNTADGKLIEEYERRMANIDKYTKQIAENNRIIESTVKNIDTSDYVTDFSQTQDTGSPSGSKGKGPTDYAAELSKARLRAERETERLRIQIRQEGYDRRRALAKQEYEETVADISRQQQETVAEMDAARKKGDAVPQSQYDSVAAESDRARILAKEKLNLQLQQIDKEYNEQAVQDLIDYNRQYGTYAEKRLAIAQDYARKIISTETDGEKQALARQMKQALAELDFSRFKETMNWEIIFGNLSGYTKKELEKVKTQLETFRKSQEYKDAGLADKEAVDKALADIQSDINEKGGLFGGLVSSISDYRTALAELEDAQKKYEEALRSNDEAVMESARKVLNAAQGKVVTTRANVNENGRRTVERVNGLTDAILRLGTSSEMTLSELGSLTSSVGSLFGEMGEKVGGIVGAALSVLDAVGTQGVKGFTENLNKTLGNALRSVAEAGWFGLIDFGGLSNRNVDSDTEKLRQSNEDLSEALDRLTERMEEAATKEVDAVYSRQRSNLEQQMANTRRMMLENLNVHDDGFLGFGGTHSSAYRVNKGMAADDWRRISDLVGKSVTDAGTFFSLSSEEMALVADEATDLYTKIKNLADDGARDAAQFMDEYIEYYRQLEQLEEERMENLTGISFDSVKDSFRDMLLDMESDTETFASDFEKMMQSAIIESMMSSKYDSLLKGWYEDFAEAMADGRLTKQEQGQLESLWENIVSQGLSERNALKDMFGWQADTAASGSGQTPTTGALTTMSQDSISRFEGIGRSLQTHLINVDKNVADLRASAQLANETLATISANTAHLVQIHELMEDMKINGIKVQ